MLAVDSLRASRALLVVFLFLLWSPGFVEAQAPQPKKPSAAFGEEMEVSEVLLDVLVTDEDGNVVFGLGPDDFVIEEEGNELAPESVTFYSNRRFLEMAAPEGVSVDRVPEDRYFVVLLYNPPTADSRSSQLFFRLADASRRAARWAYEELLPNDWVAVMSYDSGLRLHQDFTTDRKAIDRALRRAAAGKKPEGQWKSRSGSEGGGPSLEHLPVDKELMQSTPTIYAGLTVLAEALGEIRGRKNLILFGMDFPSQLSVVSGPTDPVRYPPMMQELNASNVAVHTIALANRVDQETLYQLAEDTGGIHDWNFPDFSVPLRGIAKQNNGYYLLSYRSAHPRNDSGYQEVEIRTVNPEFEVLARGGYLYGQ
ncbi:MAG: VWA domain-containing protein [Acidobacteriota bacterium]|nr:VWA domain-containing protein [Acidobacteriota bacterium]